MNMIEQVQKAVYTTLAGDSALMGMVAGVYDFVPQGTDLPYVRFGSVQATDAGLLTRDALEVVLTLEIHSRERGRAECYAVLERLHTLLHQADITVTGYTLVEMRVAEADVVQQDELSYLGRVQLAVTVKE